jgi:hypothetical protein
LGRLSGLEAYAVTTGAGIGQRTVGTPQDRLVTGFIPDIPASSPVAVASRIGALAGVQPHHITSGNPSRPELVDMACGIAHAPSNQSDTSGCW